jgi:uncharacterized alpha-E superfamily protein
VSFFLLSDEKNPDSLISCVRHARELARGVRESISTEMWEELNTLHQSLALPGAQRRAQGDSLSFQRLVRERLQYFQGLAGSTLAHDEPWNFLNLGTYLERADGVVRLLSRQAHLLAPREEEETTDADMVRWLAVLRSCGSAEAYARFYSLRVEPIRIVEFLLLNPVFPQSVRFALAAADDALSAVAGADAAVLVTEWDEFKQLDFAAVAQAMSGSLIIDGRNALDPEAVAAAGLTYEGIGRS